MRMKSYAPRTLDRKIANLYLTLGTVRKVREALPEYNSVAIRSSLNRSRVSIKKGMRRKVEPPSRELLTELYKYQKMSYKDLAMGYGVSIACVQDWMKLRNIQSNDQSEYRGKFSGERSHKWKGGIRRRNNGRTRKNNFRRKYGLSIDQYEKLLKKQNGACRICLRKPKRKKIGKFNNDVFLHVDHKGRKIRGLLCGCCNRGLGMFKDNLKSLSRAIAYLKRNSCA